MKNQTAEIIDFYKYALDNPIDTSQWRRIHDWASDDNARHAAQRSVAIANGEIPEPTPKTKTVAKKRVRA